MQDHEFLFDSKKQEVIEVFGTKGCNDTVYLCFKKKPLCSWSELEESKSKIKAGVLLRRVLQQSEKQMGLDQDGSSGSWGRGVDRSKIRLDVELTGLPDALHIEDQSKGGIKDDSQGFGLRCCRGARDSIH